LNQGHAKIDFLLQLEPKQIGHKGIWPTNKKANHSKQRGPTKGQK